MRSDSGQRVLSTAMLLFTFGSPACLTALAQSAEFFPIPGVSDVSSTNEAFCGLSGTSGYSGVRVSDDGRVVSTVGYSAGDFSGGAVPRFGIRWTQSEGTSQITPNLDGLYAVTGLSADGSTIFGSEWRWTQSGGYEDLTPRLRNEIGWLTRLIFGCSSDGQTVAGTDGFFPLEIDVFRWQIDESDAVILPRAAEAPQGYFYFNTISGDGLVVAGATQRFDSNDPTIPTTYAGVIVTDQGANVITEESQQSGVSDLSFDGSVAAGYLLDGAVSRAFRWTAETGLEIIDDFQTDGTYSRAINADGSVIVGDALIFGQPGTRAFIWSRDRGVVDLQGLLESEFGLGDALSGWTLLVATDVSADGKTIVGQGVNPDGCEQAFMVRLPGATCTADFDGSGFLDTEDFDSFVVAFESGVISADFDGSGFVDTEDFDAFVRAFEAGC